MRGASQRAISRPSWMSRSTIMSPVPWPPLTSRQRHCLRRASPSPAGRVDCGAPAPQAPADWASPPCAIRISRPNAAIVASSASTSPLVATITGSNTIGTPASASSRSATAFAVSADPIMPIFTASTPISPTTESICAITISVGTGCTACTPSVFCAVIAVIAVIAWPPSIVTVLISAWMPAPPPESEPAMIRTRGVMPAA